MVSFPGLTFYLLFLKYFYTHLCSLRLIIYWNKNNKLFKVEIKTCMTLFPFREKKRCLYKKKRVLAQAHLCICQRQVLSRKRKTHSWHNWNLRFRTSRKIPCSSWFRKTFDSLRHNFLSAALKYYDFGNDFIKWIKTLTESQESCVMNGRDTTKYFRLERGARQGDPISAYLFIFSPLRFFLFS